MFYNQAGKVSELSMDKKFLSDKRIPTRVSKIGF